MPEVCPQLPDSLTDVLQSAGYTVLSEAEVIERFATHRPVQAAALDTKDFPCTYTPRVVQQAIEQSRKKL